MLVTHFHRNGIHHFLNGVGINRRSGIGRGEQTAGMHIIQFLLNRLLTPVHSGDD
jgi:hypothetical protein